MSAYIKIIDLMHTAKQHIKYPKIKLRNDYTLQVAGSAAKFPMSVNITDGKPYGSNKWYGRIHRNGKLEMPNHMQEHGESLQIELQLFAENPTKYAKLYGASTGSCMYCSKHLTNPQSVAVGYGPICADNYGLPHGELDAEVAQEMASFEVPIEDIKPDCDCGKYPPNMKCAGNFGGKCKKDVEPEPKFIETKVMAGLTLACKEMLSEAQHHNLIMQIANCQGNADFVDEYNLMVTALWEHTI